MAKFIASKRINERTIKELDYKVQKECYLREKKEAILEDRRGDIVIKDNQREIDDDQKSCL